MQHLLALKAVQISTILKASILAKCQAKENSQIGLISLVFPRAL